MLEKDKRERRNTGNSGGDHHSLMSYAEGAIQLF